MKLGFVSAIVPDQTLASVMETAHRLGYDCVEVMCWPPGKAERRYAGVTHIDVCELGSAGIQEIRRLTSSSGIQISALGYYPNPLSPDRQESAAAVEHLQEVIIACQRLELTTCTTFVGRDWTRTVEENWPRFCEVWPPLVDFAADHGVRIGIENCPMLFSRDEWPGGKNLARSPAIWRRMFEEIPSPNFGLNYDPSHLVWQHMDPVAPLREFADRLFHVHAKDVRIDRQRLDQVGILAHPHDYHTPKLPGMGDVPWGRFFSTLTDCGYDGSVCVEVEDRAYEGSLASRIASLRQSATYLRNFLPPITGKETS